jgi:hypothetical protein
VEPLTDIERYRDPMSVPLPDDPHQSPHPESEQWNDPDWRAEWLDGLTDDELNEMSPRQKGTRLKAYVYANGHDHYGVWAEQFSLACDFFGRTGVNWTSCGLTNNQMVAIGAELMKGY